MSRWRQRALLAWFPIILAGFLVGPAQAHRRSLEPAGPPAARPAAPERLTAPALWSHIQQLEAVGDISACADQLLKFINVFPREPQRPQALLQFASLARADGQIDKALKVYTLAAALYPDTQTAEQARLERLILEFYEELGKAEPLATFQRFLNKLASGPARAAPEALREPLAAGWQAVERQLAASSPCPAALLERLLVVWELHPRGTRPPGAALQVGRALKDQGLAQEAEPLLHLARERGSGPVRGRAIIELLELAWASRGLPGFLQTLDRLSRQGEEVSLALHAWPLKLVPDKGANPLKSAVPADLAAAPGPAREVGSQALWACLLGQPLPESLREVALQELARASWTKGDVPQAARLYQAMATEAASPEQFAFYQDRLGLAHLQRRDQSAALEVFQGIERAEDPFWQLLAQTRLMDLELARLQTAPAP